MEAFFNILIWAGLIFLMVRFGAISRFMQQEHGRIQSLMGPNESNEAKLLWVPPAQDIDPACGKTVTTEKAKSSVYRGNVYYFCSRECREVFEAAPNLYLNGHDAGRGNLRGFHA